MRLLTEEERAAVLTSIADRERALRDEYNRMPFVTKTKSHADRKARLEEQLEQLEAQREQYKTPKVFVALDG